MIFNFSTIMPAPVNMPLQGDVRLTYYYGPNLEEYADPTYSSFGGNPNDTGTWVENFYTTQWSPPINNCRIGSGFQLAGSGAWMNAVAVNAILRLDACRSQELDRCAEGGDDVADAINNALLGSIITTRIDYEWRWSSEDEDPGGHPYARDKGYWIETVAITPLVTLSSSLVLASLHPNDSGSLVCEILASCGTSSTTSGVTFGLSSTDFVAKYLENRHKAFFTVFSLPQGFVTDDNPLELMSAAGMKKLWEGSSIRSFAYEQDGDGNWWKIGTATFWNYEYYGLSLGVGDVGFNGSGGLHANTRVQPRIPGML